MKRTSLRMRITAAAVGLLLVLTQAFSVWNLLKTRSEILDSLLQTEWSGVKGDASGIQRELAGAEMESLSILKIWARTVFYRKYSDRAVLSLNGEELANSSPYVFDTAAGEPARRWEDAEGASYLERVSGRYLLITELSFTADCGEGEEELLLLHYRDITDVERGLRRTFLQGLGAALALSAVLAIALYIVLRRILTPFYRLKAAADVLASGDYGARADVPGGDEVGRVAEAFNRMAESVEGNVRELSAVNEKQRRLIGALSHELKTPMTAIQGYAELLQRVELTQERRMGALGYIEGECRRLSRLSEKMLLLVELSGEEQIEKKPVSVPALCAQAEEAVRYRLARRGQSLRVEAEAGIILGDADLLLSFLTNLIDNAGKASPDGAEILLSGGPEGLYVTDPGRGIKEEEIEKVTEPFYRVDKARSRREGGAGLGLALCSQIARVHGGGLVIESRPEASGLTDETGRPVHGTKAGMMWGG